MHTDLVVNLVRSQNAEEEAALNNATLAEHAVSSDVPAISTRFAVGDRFLASVRVGCTLSVVAYANPPG